MSPMEIIGGILIILIAVVITIAVTLQEPKGSLGSAFGGNESSFYDKNRGRTLDATLARVTKIGGIALFVITLGVMAINMFIK